MNPFHLHLMLSFRSGNIDLLSSNLAVINLYFTGLIAVNERSSVTSIYLFLERPFCNVLTRPTHSHKKQILFVVAFTISFRL